MHAHQQFVFRSSVTHRPAGYCRKPSLPAPAAAAAAAVPSPASSSPHPAPDAAPLWLETCAGTPQSVRPCSPRTSRWNRIWDCDLSPPEWSASLTGKRSTCRRWRVLHCREPQGQEERVWLRLSAAPGGFLLVPDGRLHRRALPRRHPSCPVWGRRSWCRKQCL